MIMSAEQRTEMHKLKGLKQVGNRSILVNSFNIDHLINQT